MISWLSPSVLARSAAEVVLSGVFARYADKRETQAALSGRWFSYELDEGETALWVDYAADVGDGFDSTYTIARLLAEPVLRIEREGIEGEELDAEELTRGRLLVLGGDQVYPSASLENYFARFIGPYRAAMAEIVDEAQRPHLFAIPGNHDWYDGLTSFMRVFAQGAGIGGWMTPQKRSYFALRLPYGWWLWGMDIQFDAYIDGPQLDYFRRVALRTRPGDRVILATAKPSWVGVRDPHDAPQSWRSLAYFEKRVLGVNGATLALTLTGDLHHYSRYEPVTGSKDPKITAGGGGAYLSPTHWLPEDLRLPDLTEPPVITPYTRRKVWPSTDKSRGMRWGILWHLLPWKTFSLNWLLAAIYALIAVLLAVGVHDAGTGLTPSLAAHSGLRLLADAYTVWGVLLALALLFALGAWARSGYAPWAAGFAHWAVQLAAAITICLLLLEQDPFEWADQGFLLGYVVAAATGVAGALVGRWILVGYLLLCQLLHASWHANEVFAAQSRRAGTGYKNFLRMRIDADGLELWALGVPGVPRWPEALGEGQADDDALQGVIGSIQVIDHVSVRRSGP